MLTLSVDAMAPVPRPLTVKITCDGPAMLGVLPSFCAGSVSVRVVGADRFAAEVAKQTAQEKGWTRRMSDHPAFGELWLCKECGR